MTEPMSGEPNLSEPGPIAVLIVAGPTASGKSALALRLARDWGGEIVNADALQVYADLAILTARPGPQALKDVPHHLYGVVDGAEAWSTGRWLRAARAVLADIHRRGRLAIVTGGTGLYLRALTEGLADIPPIPEAIRAAARGELDADGEVRVRARLAQFDPAAAQRIAAGDRQRLTRALEVWRATGRAWSDWLADGAAGLPAGSWSAVAIEPPRAELYAACDARAARMLDQGAAAEVSRLLARDLPPQSPILKAVGVRAISAHLAGALSLDEALDAMRRDTRHYAKRQLTWLRGQCPDWPRVSSPEAFTGASPLRRAP